MHSISENGIDLIKEFEGLRLTAYQDSVGVWTIGWGSTGDHVKPYMKITEAQAEQLLKDDLVRFENCVNEYVKVPINQNEFDALCSFSFNLGCSALAGSTLLRKLNAGNSKQEVADEFGRWVKAGDEVLPGLVRRREAEANLFLTPVGNTSIDWVIVAKQDTYLKTEPKQSSELDAEQKLFVSKGSTWQWETITMIRSSSHSKVTLVQKPDSTWYIYQAHWDIITDNSK